MKEKQLEMKFYLWLCMTLLWCMLIFAFSAFPATSSDRQSGYIVQLLQRRLGEPLQAVGLPLPAAQQLSFLVRKAAHSFVYAVLGFFSGNLFCCKLSRIFIDEHSYRSRLGFRLFGAALFCAVYASTDELHQRFVAGRSGQLSDVLLDTAAAAFMLLFLYGCLRCKMPNRAGTD